MNPLVPEARPMEWADAVLKIVNSPGVYVVAGLLALFIVSKWPPWRKKE